MSTWKSVVIGIFFIVFLVSVAATYYRYVVLQDFDHYFYDYEETDLDSV